MKRSHHEKHHHSVAPYELDEEKQKEISKFNDSMREIAFKIIKSTIPGKIVDLSATLEVNNPPFT